ncbi:hypothetical protein [Acetobacter oryzoeni]
MRKKNGLGWGGRPWLEGEAAFGPPFSCTILQSHTHGGVQTGGGTTGKPE